MSGLRSLWRFEETKLKRLLIADDSKTVRMVLHKTLLKLGEDWIIHEAADGPSILDSYFDFEPAIVLLDVELPGVDGWEILRCIREIDDKTIVIMITSSRLPEHVQRAIEMGASGFVGKPFDKDELAEALGVRPLACS